MLRQKASQRSWQTFPRASFLVGINSAARQIAPWPHPLVIFLEEALNGLDRDLRQSTKAGIIRTLRELNVTAILVTHDPDEAFEVADEVAAMVDGLIVQESGTLEIYTRPLSPAVAKLTRPSYLLDGTIEGRQVRTYLGLADAEEHEESPADRCVVSVLPEEISSGSACDGTRGRVISLSIRNGVRIASIKAVGQTFSVPLLRNGEIEEDGNGLVVPRSKWKKYYLYD